MTSEITILCQGHFKMKDMTLFPQQQEALVAVKTFLEDCSKQVFILRGYAGTGKTTLIEAFMPLLNEYGKIGVLMAPTGRAAKVLEDKTGYEASTIHHVIYQYGKMQAVRHDKDGKLITVSQSDERSKGDDDLQFWFGIRKLDEGTDPSKLVYIVDESSLVSSRFNPGETLHFGTDILLDDLMTYANLGLGGKIIFVGDPAQLPPVGDNRSAALVDDYFTDKSLKVSSFELTEVIRQSKESVILKDAMMVRDLLGTSERNALCFDRKDDEVMDITPLKIIDDFCMYQSFPCIGKTVVVCYSNSLVKDYNDAIRERYFPDAKHVVAGDILQIVRNNINNELGIELYNGDFVRVVEVSPQTETQSAPVWKNINGERTRVVISIVFREVTLQTEKGKLIKCNIVDSLLNSRDRSLNGLETVALYINFRMRHPELREKVENFAEMLMGDPYFNAVQAKYGYAITAHKSQGGEWPTVFVDYSGRTGLNDDCLRWIYTATTRAQKMLYGVNMPNVTPLEKLTFNPINRISRPAKEAFSFGQVPSDGLLPDSASLHQKNKCFSSKENLLKFGFVLSKVEMLQYVDRYTVETPNGEIKIDCQYNSSGIYVSYRPLAKMDDVEKIISALCDESNMEYRYEYLPSSKPLELLFNRVCSSCDSLSILITNVVEHAQQYYVTYYLRTSGRFSQMMFYYKSSGFLTHCIPSSDIGSEDLLLQNLIDCLS
jgi:hypothetical protein